MSANFQMARNFNVLAGDNEYRSPSLSISIAGAIERKGGTVSHTMRASFKCTAALHTAALEGRMGSIGYAKLPAKVPDL
jgi:hypothetical protein